jgi:hypothetical protein
MIYNLNKAAMQIADAFELPEDDFIFDDLGWFTSLPNICTCFFKRINKWIDCEFDAIGLVTIDTVGGERIWQRKN